MASMTSLPGHLTGQVVTPGDPNLFHLNQNITPAAG